MSTAPRSIAVGTPRARRVLLCLLLACAVRAAMAIDCVENGTQLERNLCATLDAEAASSELVALYARASASLDPAAAGELARHQAAWTETRDAALAAAFPCGHDDPSVCFGADTPRQYARLQVELTRARSACLRRLIAGGTGTP